MKLLVVQSLTSKAAGCVYATIRIPKNQALQAKFYVVDQISRHLPVDELSIDEYTEFANLKLADPTYGKTAQIDALFGINIWVKILGEGVKKSPDGLVAAQNTSFGWVIYRKEIDTACQGSNYVFHNVKMEIDPNLIQLTNCLQKFWEVENLPVVKLFTPEEKECERIF